MLNEILSIIFMCKSISAMAYPGLVKFFNILNCFTFAIYYAFFMRLVGYLMHLTDDHEKPEPTPWPLLILDIILVIRMPQLLLLKNSISDKMNGIYHTFFVAFCSYTIMTLFVHISDNYTKNNEFFNVVDMSFMGMG